MRLPFLRRPSQERKWIRQTHIVSARRAASCAFVDFFDNRGNTYNGLDQTLYAELTEVLRKHAGHLIGDKP